MMSPDLRPEVRVCDIFRPTDEQPVFHELCKRESDPPDLKCKFIIRFEFAANTSVSELRDLKNDLSRIIAGISKDDEILALPTGIINPHGFKRWISAFRTENAQIKKHTFILLERQPADTTLIPTTFCVVCRWVLHDPMPKCARCQRVRYCSIRCQQHDWPHHKTTCKRQCGDTG